LKAADGDLVVSTSWVWHGQARFVSWVWDM
jgi:hypothetical protein